MCPLLAPVFQGFFFFFLQWPLTVLMNQTRQAVRTFKQSIILRCLCVKLKKGFIALTPWLEFKLTASKNYAPDFERPLHSLSR
jgi:hypothetical protein